NNTRTNFRNKPESSIYSISVLKQSNVYFQIFQRLVDGAIVLTSTAFSSHWGTPLKTMSFQKNQRRSWPRSYYNSLAKWTNDCKFRPRKQAHRPKPMPARLKK